MATNEDWERFAALAVQRQKDTQRWCVSDIEGAKLCECASEEDAERIKDALETAEKPARFLVGTFFEAAKQL